MPSLTRPEARARAELVAVQDYQLDVDLTGDGETFRSTTAIRFTATQPGGETFVELRPAALHAARLNGTALDPAELSGGRLRLADLRADNQLEVTAEFRYSHASEGMHRFVDPVDGAVYIYAQPSITYAPAFMACFDQPDLKAPVTVRVSADPSWLVRGNGVATRLAPGRWELAPTPPLSTYLIALVAGPFQQRSTEHDGVPLNLYARASLAEHLDREADELFEVTAAGLDRYHELFGIRYPFGHYDQAFVPELSWGAMELPGCVLVRDELVFRGPVTDHQREQRAVLIAHEMAHMWFGNLVTMRWWDDLWLNESFADYLGWRVVAEATRWRTAWTSYAVSRKLAGYAADQRPSTHPVAAAEVPDTVVALANFDGISYAKGSAVLRQLVAWVGDEAFRAGLRRYFETFAYRNATLADLLAALSEASGRDLTRWAQVWLREPQVNTLHPELPSGNGGSVPGRLMLRQTAPAGYPVLRPHRVQVGVYHRVDGALVRRERVPVDLDPDRDGELTEVPGLTGLADLADPSDLDGALVLVNDGDLTYAKIRPVGLDPAVALPRMADPHARALLWATLWDACRDGELPAARFVELAVAALPAETVPGVFESMLGLTLDPAIARYLPPAERPAAYAAVAEVCRAVLARAEPGSGAQLAAARGLVRCAGEPDLGWLSGWLAGSAPPPGLVVDPDLRWAVLLRLAALGGIEPTRIDQEQRRDPTERGRQEATRCRAARPDPAAKQAAWQLVTADRAASNRIVVAAAVGLWQPDQPELTTPYVPRYFAEIGATAAWRPEQMLAAVTRAAYPGYAVEPATLTLAQQWLAGDAGARGGVGGAGVGGGVGRAGVGGAGHPIVRREIVDGTDDLRRALAVRAAAVAGSRP